MAAPLASTAKPGEIWYVHINDAIGHEQDKDRPVLVNHNQSKLIMSVPFTKNQDALRFPHSHLIQSSVQNGLTIDSVAQVYQTRTMAYSRFQRKMGVLEKIHFEAIIILLQDYFKDYLK